jgi:hypothetical protein
MIAQVPELWDGGFWYIVPSKISEEGENGIEPDISGTGYIGWIHNEMFLVRVVSARIVNSLPTSEFLFERKPYGRLGGH